MTNHHQTAQQTNTTAPVTTTPQKPPMHWFLKLVLESVLVGAVTLAMAFALAWFGN
jgi:hypothetical protein